MEEFNVKFNSRILNDGLVTVISGSPKDLEAFALALEREIPEQCGWLDEIATPKPNVNLGKIDYEEAST